MLFVGVLSIIGSFFISERRAKVLTAAVKVGCCCLLLFSV